MKQFKDKVAVIVFQAIKDNVFYILPHTDTIYKRSIKYRMNNILSAFQQNELYRQ
jgi:hypothetical protein